MKALYFAPVVLPALLACTNGSLPSLPTLRVPAADNEAITRGFVCTTTPTEAYSPGYVFRVDRAGSQLLVNPLSDQAEVFRSKTLFGTYSATVGRGAGLKFALDTAVEGMSGSADVGASSTQTTNVTFTDGDLVQMTDAGVQKITEVATADLVPIAGSSYFVVRDSIQAKGFDITLSRQDEAHLGGQVGVRDLVSADPSLSFEGESGLVIRGTFPDPLNVCIRAVRMDPIAPVPGAEPAPVGGPAGGAKWRVTTFAASPSDIVGLSPR